MLELAPFKFDENYAKKWLATNNDYVVLCRDGVRLNDSVYRVGGFGCDLNKPYFLLLKQVESFYSKDVLKHCKDNYPNYLSNCSCIIDQNGVEKVIVNQFEYPYLCGGLICSNNKKYYNIETGELYCESFTSMNSNDFIFLNNEFDIDPLKRGVLKINKNDGSVEFFIKN